MANTEIALGRGSFIVEVTTPIVDDGIENVIDRRSFKLQLAYAKDCGAEAVLVGGPIGDGDLLAYDEHIALYGYCQQAKAPFVAHVGRNGTAWCSRLAEEARLHGAVAVCAGVPLTSHLSSEDISVHFGEIEEAANLPLYLYSAGRLSRDLCDELRRSLPHFSGTISYMHDLNDYLIVRKFLEDTELHILNFNDLTIPLSIKENLGVVSSLASIFGELVRDYVNACRSEDRTEVLRLEPTFHWAVQYLDIRNPALLVAIQSRLGLAETRQTIAPRRPLSDARMAALMAELTEHDLVKP